MTDRLEPVVEFDITCDHVKPEVARHFMASLFFRSTMDHERLEVNQMGMVEKLDELKLRREKVEAGGGAERVEKQHKSGKKTAR